MNWTRREIIAWPPLAVALAALAAGGCVGPLASLATPEIPASHAARTPVPVAAAPEHLDPRTIALRKAYGQSPSSPEAALAEVLDELEEIGAIDRAAQQQLIADLKTAKPEHYPLIVSQFRAALAYQRQTSDRPGPDDAPPGAAAMASAESPAAEGPPSPALRRRPPVRSAAHVAGDLAPGRAAMPATPVVLNLSPEATDDDAAPPTATLVNQPAQQVIHPGAATSPLPLPTDRGDWRAALDQSIDELQRTLSPQPSTVAELHDHLRLRALQVLAGRQEEAYRPIPGASPAQQDYWSKQLFALGAYLNEGGTVDDKQRAAAALLHMDEARAALGQLATLQVRSMAFASSVEGFGVYQSVKHAEFTPGQQAKLYAEVENFGSASTAAGYETTLGTSYQVLDAEGRRVDGGQFPDVKDVCRSQRRDFHLVYGVTLPTGI
ncbi:MAG TPA: hypothetical protein PKC18_20275, partial [Lacipirellulaceae bacterium]|nr:hypothetical protein [Lacipirellulaceae bacterium]